MNVCRALVRAQDGAKVARKVWADRDIYLVAQVYEEGEEKPAVPLFDKWSGGFIDTPGWTPDQEDLFAQDWFVILG